MSIECLIQEKKRIAIIVLITQVMVKDNVISRFIPQVVFLKEQSGKWPEQSENTERWYGEVRENHEGDKGWVSLERKEGGVIQTVKLEGVLGSWGEKRCLPLTWENPDWKSILQKFGLHFVVGPFPTGLNLTVANLFTRFSSRWFVQMVSIQVVMEWKRKVSWKRKREVVMEREGGCVIREKAEGVLKREGGRCRGGGRRKAVMNTWWKGKRAVVI